MLSKLVFSSRGEIKRGKFILGCILAIIIFITLAMIPPIIEPSIEAMRLPISVSVTKIFTALVYLFALVLLGYSKVCLGIKRLRDMGASSWFSITLLIPLVNFLALLFFMVWPSKKMKIT